MSLLPSWILILAGYGIGSIPFGLLIARFFYRIDIRQHGSGNPGATNVWRVLGKKPGMTTLVLDIVKGVLSVLLAKNLFPADSKLAIYSGLSAILGHNWSVFLKFKGGKGVATSAGVFLALIPLQAGLAVAGFLIFFLATHYVSVGSIAGALVLMISSMAFHVDPFLQVIVILASVMVIVKHIPNMKRLAQGTEPKAIAKGNFK